MELQYKEYGNKDSGLLICFLHGGGVSGWMWQEQINYFQSYHCLVPDLPEHGASKDCSPFSIRFSAESIIKIIENIAPSKKIAIIGFSLGAQVVIEILSLKPNFAHYAIINSPLVVPMRWMKKYIPLTIKLSYPLVQNRLFAKIQARTLYIKENQFETYFQETRQIKVDTFIRVLEENMSYQIPPNFHLAKGKILITVGEKEKKIMKQSKDLLLEANPNIEGMVIPNIGHGISLAKPAYFNELIVKWLGL